LPQADADQGTFKKWQCSFALIGISLRQLCRKLVPIKELLKNGNVESLDRHQLAAKMPRKAN
jgi:hypothetical protein